MNKTNNLCHSIIVVDGNQETVIKIKLGDECNNGHEDFSITCVVKELNDRGFAQEVMCGCCHDHILSIRPDLKPFVDLHLSTWQGIPMHCASNAFYWLAGYLKLSYVKYHGSTGSSARSTEDCLRIFREHIRCTESELPTLLQCRSVEELMIAIEDLGILERWKTEADTAIKQLEQWTGKEFASKAIRGHWEPVSEDERKLAEDRRASGYYSPEAIKYRDLEKAEANKAARRKQLLNEHDNDVRKLGNELCVKLFVLENFGCSVNCIYYDHISELAVNWTDSAKLVTREEFDLMVKVFAGFQTANLPQGVTLKWQERPVR